MTTVQTTGDGAVSSTKSWTTAGGTGFLFIEGPVARTRIPIPETGVKDAVTRFRTRLVLGSLGIVAVGLLAAAFVAHRVARPLVELSRAARTLGEGGFGAQVCDARGGEVGEAIAAFNQMSSRLEALEREALALKEREHLGEMGEVARGMAHALRNPLHAVGLSVDELASRLPDDPGAAEMAAAARRQIAGVDGTIRSFLALAAEGGTEENVDVRELAEEVALSVLQGARGRVRVTVEAGEARPRIRAVAARAARRAPRARRERRRGEPRGCPDRRPGRGAGRGRRTGDGRRRGAGPSGRGSRAPLHPPRDDASRAAREWASSSPTGSPRRATEAASRSRSALRAGRGPFSISARGREDALPEARILLVEDEIDQRRLVAGILRGEGYAVAETGSVDAALADLAAAPVDLVMSDWKLPGRDGMELLTEVKARFPETAFLMATAYGTIAHAVAAVRAGADDYLTKPFERAALLLAVERTLRSRRLVDENRRLSEEVRDRDRLVDLVGKSPSMERLYRQVEKLAGTDATVLLAGESGTGKELAARALHALSRRRAGPFVAVNAAAIPETLVESEFFGAEKGSYTGADRLRKGKLEQAQGGTLFLDELGELPLSMQPKLLRALQEGVVTRIGGAAEIATDARILAATNRDLAQEVAAGRFREDLYYRLNVVSVTLPPLRERREDIPLLVRHFVARTERRYGIRVEPFPSAAPRPAGRPRLARERPRAGERRREARPPVGRGAGVGGRSPAAARRRRPRRTPAGSSLPAASPGRSTRRTPSARRSSSPAATGPAPRASSTCPTRRSSTGSRSSVSRRRKSRTRGTPFSGAGSRYGEIRTGLEAHVGWPAPCEERIETGRRRQTAIGGTR